MRGPRSCQVRLTVAHPSARACPLRIEREDYVAGLKPERGLAEDVSDPPRQPPATVALGRGIPLAQDHLIALHEAPVIPAEFPRLSPGLHLGEVRGPRLELVDLHSN